MHVFRHGVISFLCLWRSGAGHSPGFPAKMREGYACADLNATDLPGEVGGEINPVSIRTRFFADQMQEGIAFTSATYTEIFFKISTKTPLRSVVNFTILSTRSHDYGKGASRI